MGLSFQPTSCRYGSVGCSEAFPITVPSAFEEEFVEQESGDDGQNISRIGQLRGTSLQIRKESDEVN